MFLVNTKILDSLYYHKLTILIGSLIYFRVDINTYVNQYLANISV